MRAYPSSISGWFQYKCAAAPGSYAARLPFPRDLAVGKSYGAFSLLLEDIIQPVEFDQMFEARVVHLAVGLAAIDQTNQAFRLRAGQLLVEVAPQTDHQRSLALAG